MQNYVVKSAVRKISNSSKIILQIDELFRLSKLSQPQNELLDSKEKDIFAQIGPVESKVFDHFLITSINLKNIEDEINEKYQDGVYTEDEEVAYPYFRTVRTRSNLANPKIQKEQANVNIPNITIGNVSTIQGQTLNLQKENNDLFAYDSEYEEKKRK